MRREVGEPIVLALMAAFFRGGGFANPGFRELPTVMVIFSAPEQPPV